MKTKQVSLILVLITIFFLSGKYGYSQDENYGIRILPISFESKVLNEKRTLLVSLPKNFKKDESYPVVYFLDGEVMTTMAAGQVDYLSRAYQVIPQLIIVGIVNTDRMRDLTPVPDTLVAKTSGGGSKLLEFNFKGSLVEMSFNIASFAHWKDGLIAM